jgi:tRNA(fMet)-specific endonuclease VapC
MALLDTTVFVDLGGRGGKKRRAEAEAIVRQLLADGESLFASRFNVAELYVGAELSNDSAAERKAIAGYLTWIGVLEFDDVAAREYGRLRADLQRRGRLVGDLDILIGAVARANGQMLVTRNPAHFAHMPGLTVIHYGT